MRVFNTYGESIDDKMLRISKMLDRSRFWTSIPTVDRDGIPCETVTGSPYRALLDSVEERLKELNKMPFARLNANRYEYSTLLYNLNTSMLWVYSGHEYKTFREYCKAELSMSYEAVTMYLKTGKYMLMRDRPLNIFGNQDYSISKLYTLSVIPLNELRALTISNTITPDMTAREIQAFVREYTRRAKTASMT